ncbi:hypothetical protein [Spiroplasma alleghenense]|uniref:Uncharacterized protein n=1 Tax=Spiroplasma alleghenense TaxID=216931 RepID=A0A345Z2V7_9MOLU|nr:hypothetical protein [Spiroplasma alleghenense]AXK50936.1 hypothetical protein SALLE_v1c02600 [Spiroplasma alleghenense]
MSDNKYKPVNYAELIISEVDSAYKNFIKNYSKLFTLPEEIQDFIKTNKRIGDQEQLEKYTVVLEQNFTKISCNQGKENFAIFLNHHFYFVRNSLINIKSIDANLLEQKLPTSVISEPMGMDIVALTAVHMLGANATQLQETYQKLELEKDDKAIYSNLIKFLSDTLNLDGESAFKMLLDNIANYLQNYNEVYKGISDLPEDDFSAKRIEMFMYCTDAYFLLGIIYKILLTTPLNNGVIDKDIYGRLVPELDAFKNI